MKERKQSMTIIRKGTKLDEEQEENTDQVESGNRNKTMKMKSRRSAQ
jgi:hypothetical protein